MAKLISSNDILIDAQRRELASVWPNVAKRFGMNPSSQMPDSVADIDAMLAVALAQDPNVVAAGGYFAAARAILRTIDSLRDNEQSSSQSV